jgi:hypothetical protein
MPEIVEGFAKKRALSGASHPAYAPSTICRSTDIATAAGQRVGAPGNGG